MNLFGRELAPEQIFALIGSLMALALWLMTLRGQRNWTRWFRGWEAYRKARREAEIRGENAPPSDGRGPWG